MSLQLRLSGIDRQVSALRVVAAVLVGTGLLLVTILHGRFAADDVGLERLGSFMSGTVGSLWSLAGLLLIYVAFLGQQKQVLQQEEELRLQREDLRDTKREMKQQTAAFEAQRFDASFFSLLGAHEAYVGELRSDKFPATVRGRALFTALYLSLRQTSAVQQMYTPFPLETAREQYVKRYWELEPLLGPYWRSLYHLFKYVDEAAPSDVERVRYAKIARARLSSDELLVFFYNLATTEGSEFLPLVRQFDLLKHLPRELLLAKNHWADLMDGAAT